MAAAAAAGAHPKELLRHFSSLPSPDLALPGKALKICAGEKWQLVLYFSGNREHRGRNEEEIPSNVFYEKKIKNCFVSSKFHRNVKLVNWPRVVRIAWHRLTSQSRRPSLSHLIRAFDLKFLFRNSNVCLLPIVTFYWVYQIWKQYWLLLFCTEELGIKPLGTWSKTVHYR